MDLSSNSSRDPLGPADLKAFKAASAAVAAPSPCSLFRWPSAAMSCLASDPWQIHGKSMECLGFLIFLHALMSSFRKHCVTFWDSSDFFEFIDRNVKLPTSSVSIARPAQPTKKNRGQKELFVFNKTHIYIVDTNLQQLGIPARSINRS